MVSHLLSPRRYLEPDPLLLTEEANESLNPKFHNLNRSIVQLINDFSMINFMPLDATSEESVERLFSHIDHAMQWGEDEEVKMKDMEQYEPDEDGGDGDMRQEEDRLEELLAG